ELWTLRYQQQPDIIGRSIMVNGQAHTVIGVMRPEFLFPENERLWVTIAPYQDSMPRDDRGPIHSVFARLKPGATRQQAESELTAIATLLAATYPKENKNWTIATRS